MSDYNFRLGIANVHYLTASHALLTRVFGNDGTVDPRDNYKSMCQWDVKTPHGTVEVYDYKAGKCYDPVNGLAREHITDWHIQGDPEAINAMLDMLYRA